MSILQGAVPQMLGCCTVSNHSNALQCLGMIEDHCSLNSLLYSTYGCCFFLPHSGTPGAARNRKPKE